MILCIDESAVINIPLDQPEDRPRKRDQKNENKNKEDQEFVGKSKRESNSKCINLFIKYKYRIIT